MSDQEDKLKVLVVDDQELFRIGLSVCLSKVEGVSIIGECGDGQTAVRMCG
jgi:DNA-binding NarL/FixJ family response regulator